MKIPYVSLAFSSVVLILSMALLLKFELLERATLINAAMAIYAISLISSVLSVKALNSMLDISMSESEEVRYRAMRNLVVLMFSLTSILFAYALLTSLLPTSLFPRLSFG